MHYFELDIPDDENIMSYLGGGEIAGQTVN